MNYPVNYQIEVYDINKECTLYYAIAQADIEEFLSVLCESCPFSRVKIMQEADTIPYAFRVDFGAVMPPRYEDEICLDEYLKGYGYPYGYR